MTIHYRQSPPQPQSEEVPVGQQMYLHAVDSMFNGLMSGVAQGVGATIDAAQREKQFKAELTQRQQEIGRREQADDIKYMDAWHSLADKDPDAASALIPLLSRRPGLASYFTPGAAPASGQGGQSVTAQASGSAPVLDPAQGWPAPLEGAAAPQPGQTGRAGVPDWAFGAGMPNQPTLAAQSLPPGSSPVRLIPTQRFTPVPQRPGPSGAEQRLASSRARQAGSTEGMLGDLTRKISLRLTPENLEPALKDLGGQVETLAERFPERSARLRDLGQQLGDSLKEQARMQWERDDLTRQLKEEAIAASAMRSTRAPRGRTPTVDDVWKQAGSQLDAGNEQQARGILAQHFGKKPEDVTPEQLAVAREKFRGPGVASPAGDVRQGGAADKQQADRIAAAKRGGPDAYRTVWQQQNPNVAPNDAQLQQQMAAEVQQDAERQRGLSEFQGGLDELGRRPTPDTINRVKQLAQTHSIQNAKGAMWTVVSGRIEAAKKAQAAIKGQKMQIVQRYRGLPESGWAPADLAQKKILDENERKADAALQLLTGALSKVEAE